MALGYLFNIQHFPLKYLRWFCWYLVARRETEREKKFILTKFKPLVDLTGTRSINHFETFVELCREHDKEEEEEDDDDCELIVTCVL